MKPIRRAKTLVALALAGAMLTGCGGVSREDATLFVTTLYLFNSHSGDGLQHGYTPPVDILVGYGPFNEMYSGCNQSHYR